MGDVVRGLFVVIPVSQLTEPHQHFSCARLSALVTGTTCVKRQRALIGFRNSPKRHSLDERCANCEVGKQVRRRVGKKVDAKPTVVMHGEERTRVKRRAGP